MLITIIGDFGSHEFKAIANKEVPVGLDDLIITAQDDDYISAILSEDTEINASISTDSIDWIEFEGRVVEVYNDVEKLHKFKIKGEFVRL